MKKAWAGSLIIKLISGAILALIVLFFILMLVYAVKNSACFKDLQTQKDLATRKDTELRRYRAEYEDLNSKLDSEKRKNSVLQFDVTSLQRQVKDLNVKIEDKSKEISNLTSERKQLQDKIQGLDREINHLHEDIRNKDQEISHLHEEVSKKDTEIATLKKHISSYEWGLIGSGVAHVGMLVDDIIAHVGLNEQRKRLEVLDSENRDLKGKVHNANTTIELLGKEIESLKQDVDEVNKLRQKCQSELAHERQLYEDCMHEQKRLHKQNEIIPVLALEQAKAQMVMHEANYSAVTNLLYNGSESGYDKNTFINRVGDKKPTVVIYKTTTGYVFGGSLNIAWGQTGGFQSDPKAFTFSATNNKVCPIRDPTRAVNFNFDNFMEFGDKDFAIDKNSGKRPQGSGEADRVYKCNAQDIHSFYGESQYFTISDLLVYEIKLTKHNP